MNYFSYQIIFMDLFSSAKISCFYIYHGTHVQVPLVLSTFTSDLLHVNYHVTLHCYSSMNASKTKTLLSQPGELAHAISSPAFVRRLAGLGDTWSDRKRRRVTCPRCDKPMQEKSLKRHLLPIST
jgi:hypothetical protein